jgi:centrosomal protein CEP76
MQAFLARGCGDSEDHAVLLCNLLIGFGLDAYVCVGTNGEGSHAWVLQRQMRATQACVKQKPIITCWESLTG